MEWIYGYLYLITVSLNLVISIYTCAYLLRKTINFTTLPLSFSYLYLAFLTNMFCFISLFTAKITGYPFLARATIFFNLCSIIYILLYLNRFSFIYKSSTRLCYSFIVISTVYVNSLVLSSIFTTGKTFVDMYAINNIRLYYLFALQVFCVLIYCINFLIKNNKHLNITFKNYYICLICVLISKYIILLPGVISSTNILIIFTMFHLLLVSLLQKFIVDNKGRFLLD